MQLQLMTCTKPLKNWIKTIIVAGAMAILVVGCGTNIKSPDEEMKKDGTAQIVREKSG